MDRLTTGDRVRAAFRDAAAPAAQWTVEVTRGKKPVARGIVVDADGYILTKLSEVRGSKSASKEENALVCRFANDRGFGAIIVAENPENDLALLRISATDLPTVAWAREPQYDIGRIVVSSGAKGDAASIGVISAQRRRIHAERVSGVLGVKLGIGDGPARVEAVIEKSPAEIAGLTVGDIIERLQDSDVSNGRAFIRSVRRHKPGDVVTLRVKRGEESRTVEVTLDPPKGDFLSQYGQQIRMGSLLSFRRDGFEDAFSHDSVLVPEDCGGPLLNLSGQAIGINIARSARTESLAIPADVVQKAVADMQASLKKSAAPATP
jgi:serine protease Do